MRMCVAIAAGCVLGPSVWACPITERYPANTGNGQLSIVGGISPLGQRAADDFVTPIGNGNVFNVRVIRGVLLANFALTPQKVSMTIYADLIPIVPPNRPRPGSVVAGPPNVPASVRDLGPAGFNGIDGRAMRIFEVAYSIPSGFMQLQSGRFYWLSLFALGTSATPGAFDEAYVAVGPTPIDGEPMNKASGLAGGGLSEWTTVEECCLGRYDMAMYINAVQVGGYLADFNCDNVISVQDIFDFLTAWFAGNPGGDFNGVGGNSTQDIFDFLTAWFAGT